MDVLEQQRNSSTPAIGQLATLPVFFDLKAKPVLIAGGSKAAAWKAELLAACGAEVHVFAPRPDISQSLEDILHRPGFVHHDCDWHAAHFKHFALAIGDCGKDEGRAFHDRAREAGVPVNVIDQPEFCQFKLGSIVNRSPLVIGISTDGAAPILAQAVRRRIEAVLPHALAAWVRLAQDIRIHVLERLGMPSLRRNFWERFVDRAFSGAKPSRNDATTLILQTAEAAIRDGRDEIRLTFVAAVDDDPEYLTMKAVRILQAADVIVHDPGISVGVLELGRREATRMEYRPYLLDTLAGEGKRVVHVHDGSPGAQSILRQERAALAQQGIRFDELHSIKTVAAPVIGELAFSPGRLKPANMQAQPRNWA